MTDPDFDFEGVFDETYLYFYNATFARLSDDETEFIARLLKIAPGDRILDVPCGDGRIANRLAARGCRVTGVDVNPLYIAHAKRYAAEFDVDVTYEEADMRRLPWTGAFDYVIHWFGSFGYFDDATNLELLKSFFRALRPGGSLLIETLSRDRIVQALALGQHQLVTKVERGDNLLVDTTTFDPARGRTRVDRLIVLDRDVRRTHYTVRVFTYTELRDWLVEAGFQNPRPCDYGGTPFGLQAQRMITVAERPRA